MLLPRLPLAQAEKPPVFEQALLAFAVIAVIIFIIAVAAKKMKKISETNHEARRRELLAALDILEKNYLKRRIDQKTFEKLFKERQEELIRVEAEIQNKIKKQSPDDQELLRNIQPNKKHIATELLAEKQKILNEMDIAKTAFLKRKIDAKTFEQISEKHHSQLVEVQSKIRAIQTEENVKNIMVELKKKLGEIEQTEEKKKSEREKEIVQEIIEQLETANYLR